MLYVGDIYSDVLHEGITEMRTATECTDWPARSLPLYAVVDPGTLCKLGSWGHDQSENKRHERNDHTEQLQVQIYASWTQ